MSGSRLRSARGGCARWLVTGVAALAGCASPTEQPVAAPADRVFVGEHILTFDAAYPAARSLAIRGETIICVEADDSCGRTADAHTRIVELGARALLPGFIDAHGHVTMLAQLVDHANLSSPPVGEVRDIASLQAALRAHIASQRLAPGAWIFGWGYDDSLLAEKRHPTREELDAVAREHPIAILHVSGHLAAGNSAAFAAGGVTAATPDPPGGHIRRHRASGEPSGVVEEAALGLLIGKTALAQVATPDAIERALAVYASYGFTTVQDGATSAPALAALTRASAERELALDVVFYPAMGAPQQALPPRPLGRYVRRLKLGGIKLVLDGSPQGKTAYLTRSYLVPPPGQAADYRGYPILPQAAVDAALARFLPAGVPVIAHANGDAALDMLIGACERALAGAPPVDHRTVAIHAQTLRGDQLDRMRELRMIPSFFSAHPFFWGDWHRDSVLGRERAFHISPTRSALARGVLFTIHNDAPVVPPDAIRLLWSTVNRISRSGAVIGPNQRIATEEALRALTANGAYQYFEEASKGTLAVGKQADLVVLSQDPLALEPEKLLGLRVEETLSRGRVVFTRR
jgi:hypothetical protein